MTTSQIKSLSTKILIALLVLMALKTVYGLIRFGDQMFDYLFQNSDVFDFFRDLKFLLMFLSDISLFIGLILLVLKREIVINKWLKFYLFMTWASSLSLLIITSLSTEYSYFLPPHRASILLYISKVLNVLVLLCSAVYFYQNTSQKNYSKAIEVKKWARFFNRFIDFTLICIFVISNFYILEQGWYFENHSFLNSNPYWLILIVSLLYYFIFEFLFLQTIGKLHNNSYVRYEGHRFKAIATRTLCRFIPFDVYSFLGKKGWHDSISKTSVITFKKN